MKITIPKKIGIRTATNLILVAVILFELYLAYFFLFTKLSPQPGVTVNTTIVRINRGTLNEVTGFLEGLGNFQPASLTLTNPNPFKYSP